MKTRGFKSMLFENVSYKIVALGVALVVWMTMLGRKDASMVRELELQVLLAPNVEMATPAPSFVRVSFSGPRLVLKKMGQITEVFSVDLTNLKVGSHVIKLSETYLNLPPGVRVTSIEPKEITAAIRTSEKKEHEAKK